MNNENFGIHLLRDVVLPDILNDDNTEILYWSGKKLFDHFQEELTTDEQLVEFFTAAQFGNLIIKNATKTKYEFTLSGEWVKERLHDKKEFSLETGFLCEYVQNLTNSYCTSNLNTKSKEAIITIDVDHKSNIN